jgi:hypothetical protein
MFSSRLLYSPIHRTTELSKWTFSWYQFVLFFISLFLFLFFFWKCVKFYPVAERNVAAHYPPTFPEVIFSSFSAYCPSFLHTKYYGILAVLKMQNTCACAQNLCIARLFYSRCVFTILRDFRVKKIYFEWITSVEHRWNDADGENEEESTALPVHLSWAAVGLILARGFVGTTVLLSVTFWPHYYM